MPITFYPKPGTVLMCDFNTGFTPPEMTKRRPVVVISPRYRRSGQICIIVPLSTKAPKSVEPFHHRLDPRSLPGKLAQEDTWAKCDMVTTVSFRRLDRVFIGKKHSGKPVYTAKLVIPSDLEAIRQGVVSAIGLSRKESTM